MTNTNVMLHLGAHGTATRRFGSYAAAFAQSAAGQGCVFLGPEDVSGDFAATVARRKAEGATCLLVSDANILGTLPANLEAGLLYPQAGMRIARFAETLGASLDRVVLCTRSLDLYWCAAVSNGIFHGAHVPNRADLKRIAMARRGWRDVITDIASAAPNLDIRVLPFESYAGLPHRFLADATGLDASRIGDCAPKEAAPLLPELRRALRERGQDTTGLPFGMGRWNPFTTEEHAALRELYADDMMWLAAGADGLATLTENCPETRAGQTPPSAASKKGRNDELKERQMARPG